MSEGCHRPEADTAEGAPPRDEVATVRSHALMAGGRRLHILHDGEVYVLQITKQNKLLLTK